MHSVCFIQSWQIEGCVCSFKLYFFSMSCIYILKHVFVCNNSYCSSIMLNSQWFLTTFNVWQIWNVTTHCPRSSERTITWWDYCYRRLRCVWTSPRRSEGMPSTCWGTRLPNIPLTIDTLPRFSSFINLHAKYV